MYVEGSLQTEEWQDKDGNNRYSTEIVGDNLQMLGKKDDSNSNETTNQQSPNAATSTSPTDKSNTEVDDLPF